MKRTTTRIASSLFALAALTAGASAQAQIAINQASALSGTDYGYFQDQPGFPVAIVVAGSYKLTSNLVVPLGISGVEIWAPGVTLDLNGFEIRSASGAICQHVGNYGVSCPNSLGKTGVEIKQGSAVVRNGRISGFYTGLQFKGADHLENLIIENNVRGVISDPYSGARTLIRNVRAQNNDESGFWAHSALIVASASSGNGLNGFSLGDSMVIDSFASRNGSAGFRSLVGTTLTVGRNTGLNNQVNDFSNVTSMGDNVNSLNQRF